MHIGKQLQCVILYALMDRRTRWSDSTELDRTWPTERAHSVIETMAGLIHCCWDGEATFCVLFVSF